MPTGPDLSQLSISQLHEMTGKHRRWLKKRLTDRGVTPSGRDGRTIYYPTREALEAIYDREGLDPATEQARLHQVRREQAELELARLRGEVAPVGDFEETQVRVASEVRSKILGVPAKTAQELAGTSVARECHAIVEEALYEALEALAETKVDPPPEE